ncbi:NAD-dependent epimerase/dehydratase family protein [Dankookia sp. P2]|uniref:NAD-dependent epimerase/dehydratase family protein n=1 Tax=Dankookia sp. P2 TaxID=3423955 RepID=UPI003D668984
MASTSSAYGANTTMPFRETDAVASPLNIYAATKMATEQMAHAYAALWRQPMTMFRFFTVYGPWGRPDMAFFKFTDAILKRPRHRHLTTTAGWNATSPMSTTWSPQSCAWWIACRQPVSRWRPATA